MSRSFELYVDDMIEALQNVVEFTTGLEQEAFFKDKRTRDATLRNLEILGEDAKKIPTELRELAAQVPWRAHRGTAGHIGARLFWF